MATARAQAMSGAGIHVREVRGAQVTGADSNTAPARVPRYWTPDDDETATGWMRRMTMRALWTPYNFWLVAAACLFADAVLTTIIVLAIPYTEIDFRTYMQQTRLFLKGERRYDHITGDTGPCVYPALHLYIYAALSCLSDDAKLLIRRAQVVYAALYMATQFVTMAIYKAARIPPIMLPLLLLSKRLHSIYVLRLFNDCWAVLLMYVAVWAMCTRRWQLASAMYSLALGVKMNIVLYAPAMAAIYLRALGWQASAVEACKVLLIQVMIGGPFLQHNAKAYISSAFDLSRAFLYKWTVNWRFVDETTFLDKRFANALLALHATSVLAWLMLRWTGLGRRDSLTWLRSMLRAPGKERGRSPSARFIVSSLFISNLLGITFSRSLHYQFYSWYAQQLPALVYLSQLPIIVKVALPVTIELAWNTFPSTPVSSGLLLASHAVLLAGLWQAHHDDASLDERRPDDARLDAEVLKPYARPPRRA